MKLLCCLQYFCRISKKPGRAPLSDCGMLSACLQGWTLQRLMNQLRHAHILYYIHYRPTQSLSTNIHNTRVEEKRMSFKNTDYFLCEGGEVITRLWAQTHADDDFLVSWLWSQWNSLCKNYRSDCYTPASNSELHTWNILVPHIQKKKKSIIFNHVSMYSVSFFLLPLNSAEHQCHVSYPARIRSLAHTPGTLARAGGGVQP